MKRVFNVAIADGRTESNPVHAVKFFKENNQRFIADEEEVRLRKALGEDEWPKVAFALHTGFRRANQFRLRWSEVHFETGLIRATQTKAGDDYRVPVNDELRAILRDLPSRLRSKWVFPQ